MSEVSQPPEPEEFFDLHQLLRILDEYKWGIAGLTALVALGATLVVFTMTPVYQATVTILIEARSNQPIRQLADPYDPGAGTTVYYGTQFEIIKSRELATRVVEKLNLVNSPEFAGRPGGKLKSLLNWRTWLPFAGKTEKPLSDAEKLARKKDAAIDTFERHLQAEYVPGTQLFKARFDAEDPKLAALVANTLADVFIESSLEGRLDVTQKTSSWLTVKLDAIKADLKRAEDALQQFREQEQLVSVGGERGFVEDELTENARRMREAQKKTTELASVYWKVQQAGENPTKLDEISTLLQSEPVNQSKSGARDAQEAVRQLEQRYGPKHPEMLAALAKQKAAIDAYHAQLLTAARGIKAEYEIARENERTMGQYERKARGTIEGLDRKQYQLRALERDVETNRQLYDTFLTRFKETDLTSSYEQVTARIVDPAVVPRSPYKPAKTKIIALATAGGLVLSLMFAAMAALFADMVRSGEELEALTKLPVLGALPHIRSLEGERSSPTEVLDNPKGSFSEGIRSIRTSMALSDIVSKKKRIVVASSVPAEGKTTIAINLAIVHGQMERTLLLEGDLRRPSIGRRCGLSDSTPGMTEYLTGTKPLEQCIYRHESGKIDVFPVGKVPPNPAEILASGRFHKLVELLSERYDRIIIDSAPCHAVSDTFILAQNCDGLVFVVKASSTTRRQIQAAVRQLRQAKIPLLGTVVNHLDMRRHGHYYGSYYQDYGYYT